jgi:phage shock protein A
LTETIQFSSAAEVRRWLDGKTISILTPVHAQAKRLRDDMNNSIQNINDVSKSLLDNSTKEIEKRNMKVYNRARALNKLSHLFLDRLKKLSPPEEVSYDTLNRYAQETQKVFLVTDIDIKNWFPRISPFFIMDRRKFLTIYERAKVAYSALNDFVSKEYIKTKTLEESLQLLIEVQNVQKQIAIIGEEKEQIKNERLPVENEIAELEKKIDELKTKGPIDKLNMVNAEIDTLTNELKYLLRHLQKPFIKMQALATTGGGAGVTPDELSKVNQYLERPFEAITSEKNGYPVLEEILQKLELLIEEDKLKLKPEKARKADQTINEILKHASLAKLQQRCLEMTNIKQQLLESTKMDEIKEDLSAFQGQVDLLKARKTSIETHEAVKENASNEAIDKINNMKRTIEKNILNSINIKVQVP